MGIPQFHTEGPDQTGGSASLTVSFTGLTWSSNDIIEIIIATDGWTPVLTTANGFALATDPVGNTASQTTNGTTVGTNECGIHVYWKRAVGSTTATDPVPVFQAPSTVSGTSWCMQINSFSGARTSGTPYTVITKGAVTTAATAVTSQAATWSLANCLLMPRVASANDDSAFNNWTMSGSSGPSGTQAPNTGWHTSTGNACAFTGDEGGYATAQTGKTATTTFATTTKQALVTLVMASLAEPAAATGNESATLAPSSAASAGGITVTGNEAAADDVSTPASSGGVTVTGTGAATLGASIAASSGSTITRTGNEAATLGSSIAASSGTVTAGATGTEVATLAPSSGVAAGAVTVTGTGSAALAPSTAASAGGVSITGNAAAVDSASSAAATGTVFTPATLAVGALAFHQKANTTGTTGTLVTRTAYPAWTPSTSYAIRTDDRVTNAGNTYECANSANTGTSASSGGPTTMPPPVTDGAIADGTTHWNPLVAGSTGAVNTTTGSLILVSVGTGKDATSPNPPTDNKGNTYSLVGSKAFFAGFPPSSAATYAALAAAGGAGHTWSKPWGAGNDGGGDEVTVAAVEIIGGTHIQDHSSVEASPNGANVVTSNPVTITDAAILVCFAWLNGTTHADGFLHTATPGSGFSMLPLASGLLEIGNGGGQVQMCTLVRQVAAPAVTGISTYTASITTAPGLGEGAIMQLVAIQGQASITGTEAALLSGSTAASSGTVTTPRTGTEAATLGSSAGGSAGTVSITGNGAASDGDSLAAAAGTVAVTGTSASTCGGSIASSSGTLIPVITGNESASLGASLPASFGTVFSGHAGNVAGILAGSLGAAAGTVLVTGSGAAVGGASVASSTGQVIITGAAAMITGDSLASSRAITPGTITPRLLGTLATNGQLTATLQLQGVTVADITGPITVFQGDTAGFLLTVTKDDGSPFDLSTATAIEVRVKLSDGAPDPPVIALSLGAGVTPLDQTTSPGKATIAFSTGDTAVAPNRYRIDVAVTAPGLRQHVIPPRDFTIATVV